MNPTVEQKIAFTDLLKSTSEALNSERQPLIKKQEESGRDLGGFTTPGDRHEKNRINAAVDCYNKALQIVTQIQEQVKDLAIADLKFPASFDKYLKNLVVSEAEGIKLSQYCLSRVDGSGNHPDFTIVSDPIKASATRIVLQLAAIGVK